MVAPSDAPSELERRPEEGAVPPALVALRGRRRLRDPAAALKKALRMGLLLGGVAFLAAGQPIGTLFCFIAWAGVGQMRVGGPRYPLVLRRTPGSPEAAALLELRPGRLIRSIDPHTYVAEMDGLRPQLEIWQYMGGPRFSDVWFDLELGPEPRVSGHADRVGPLFDGALVDAPAGERVVLRGQWLGWILDPAELGLEVLIERARGLRRRLEDGSVSTPRAAEAMARGQPFVSALVMLADPDRYASAPEAREVRPSWRWLARDGSVCREARLRALRFLALTADPDEVVELLDDLGEVESREDPPARAAHHLASSSPHLQLAALAVLERVGTSAQRAAVAACPVRRRASEGAVAAAKKRTLAAIDARHERVGPGALAVVPSGAGAGALSPLEPEADEPR